MREDGKSRSAVVRRTKNHLNSIISWRIIKKYRTYRIIGTGVQQLSYMRMFTKNNCIRLMTNLFTHIPYWIL